MDIAMSFAVLGIEETREEERIRQAYREKLLENNPEDHPEGFRRLREAYEEALSYAHMSEETKVEEGELTPIGRWMKLVEKVYFCLPQRLDRKAWQGLFRDEIFMDLDYGEEVKWELFRFLSENFRLTSDIYRLLDEVFGIQEGEAEWKEHLPTAFVDYMIRKIQDVGGEEDFPYQWVTGADTADYDQFQERLYDLEKLIEKGDLDEAKQMVFVMEGLGIDHPFYRLEKARLAVLQGETDVVQTALELVDGYTENIRIQLIGGEILWKCGRKEEAVAVFRNVRERVGAAYLSEKYLAIFEKEQGHLLEAMEHCLQALQEAEDTVLEEMLMELDKAYIAKCMEEFAAGGLSAEDAHHVCTSYIRVGQAQEGIDFVLRYPDYMETIRNIHNVLSALYYHAGRYQESVKECHLWREAVQKRMEKEEEGAAHEMSMTYFCEGQALELLAEQKAGRKAVMAVYREAEQAFLQSIFYEPDVWQRKQDLLDLLILEGEFERAIALADEMLERNREWFPALVQKQRACFELDRPQEVVDLFEEARELYAKYPPIYELAIRVFTDYERYENAEAILRQAKEEKVESFGLEAAELYLKRMQCETDQDYSKLLKKAKSMLKKFQREHAAKKEMAELYYELAILEDCQVQVSSRKAQAYMEKAIRLRKNEPLSVMAYYYYSYALILKNAGKFKEAIKNYEIYRQNSEMTERLAMNLAKCYHEIENWEKAMEYYEEALLINPKQQEANRNLAAICRWIGVDKNSTAILKKALSYANRQLEICPDNAYDYRARGNICRLIGELDQAMADAKKSLELEKDNSYGFLLEGRVLYYWGEYQRALLCFQKSIQHLANPKANGQNMYRLAASCCRKMNNFIEAEKWYRDGIHFFDREDQTDFYWKLIGLYEEQKRYQDAFSLLNEFYQKKLITEEEYIDESIDLRRAVCHTKEQAKQLEQEAYESAQRFDSINAWEALADIQFFYLRKTESALEIKKKVMERVEKEQVQWENRMKYLERMQIYWEAGNQEEVEKWAKLYLRMIEKHYPILQEQFPPIEQHLSEPDYGYENLCEMIRCWIFTGQMELAKTELENLKKREMCRCCFEQECEEFFETLAIYYEAVGELEEAYSYWHRNWVADPKDEMYYYKMVSLGEKLGYSMEWEEQDAAIWESLNSMRI